MRKGAHLMSGTAVNNSVSHRQHPENGTHTCLLAYTHTLMTCIFSMFRVAASLVCTRTVNVQPAERMLSQGQR